MPIVRNNIDNSLKKITSRMVKVPKKAYKFWKNKTPKKTGNAKRSTKLKGNQIHADYEYASYLDKGHSKQAPQGMSKPTKEYLDKLVKQIMRK